MDACKVGKYNSRFKKGNVFGVLFLCTIFMFLTGCEAVFTFSPLSFLQRNPKTLSPEEKKTFAEDALTSKDPEKAKDAYEAIEELIKNAEGEEKIELQQLAADLALTASGFTDAAVDIMSEATKPENQADPEKLKTSILEAAEGIDPEYIKEYVEQINALPPEEVTADQYVQGAVGLLLSDDAIAEELKKPEPKLDVNNPVVAEALELLEKGEDKVSSGDTSSEYADLLLQYADFIPKQS